MLPCLQWAAFAGPMRGGRRWTRKQPPETGDRRAAQNGNGRRKQCKGWHRLFASGTPRVRSGQAAGEAIEASHAEIFGIRHRRGGHARPQGLGGAVALARAQGRTTTSSSSAVAGTGSATAYYLAKEHGITQRRGAGEGLARRRQYRPQHHDHPLQLSVGRERRASTSMR